MTTKYVKLKAPISDTELADLIEVCKLEWPAERSPMQKYPGITLKDSSFIMPTLQDLAAAAINTANWKVKYDLGAGTGVNFLWFKPGDRIPPHYDSPLYELDDKYQVKPVFENRECVISVVLNLNQDYTGGQFAFIDPLEKRDVKQVISLAAGEALVFLTDKGYHEITEVVENEKFQLSAFFCN